MSSLVLDLRSAEEPRDVIHRAVQALAEGKIVGFPTETVYVLAACGMHEAAVARLAKLTSSMAPAKPVSRMGPTAASRQLPDFRQLYLALKSADDALDYVPNMCSLGQRLARRCWPGPVTMLIDDHHPESLLEQLTVGVRQTVAPRDTRGRATVGLRVIAHQAIQDVARLTIGPLVVADCPHGADHDAVTAQEVVEKFDNNVTLVLDDGPTRFRQPSTVVYVHDKRYDVVRVGVVSEQTLKRLSCMIVLFVCTGNTCRSPMAEGIFRHLAAERLGCKPDQVEDRGLRVVSAGLAAMMGGAASREAVSVLSDAGIDLRSHESQPVTESLIRHADLILTMTRSHRNAILAEWPEAAERVKLLCHSGGDVHDPVGGPPEVYRRCAEQIRGELQTWIDQIEI